MPRKDHEKLECPTCKYNAGKEKWTVIAADSSSGNAYLVCREYDFSVDDTLHIGGVFLYSCPRCKTLIWGT